VLWFPDFLRPEHADALLATLASEIDWEQRSVNFGGRQVPVPRLVAWYGEEPYRYGGFTHPAASLPLLLAGLADEIGAEVTRHLPAAPRFNSVLLNCYRNGQDSMSFHADDEVQLGPEPVIASLSLGATRTLQFRARHLKQRHAGKLRHGSLLVMHGRCQQDWQHGIPKEPCTGPRINLTFRHTAPLRPGPLRPRSSRPSR
jgi:alkylated DNA repair dioxygenase AlkB